VERNSSLVPTKERFDLFTKVKEKLSAESFVCCHSRWENYGSETGPIHVSKITAELLREVRSSQHNDL
jgi:hypothetical protein